VNNGSNDADSWPEPTGGPTKESPLIRGEDIELALRAAEGLAAEADLAERQDNMAGTLAIVATAVILSAAVLTAGLLSDHVGTVSFKVFVAIAAFILLGAFAASCRWILRTHNRRKSPDLRLRLALDIVGIVREVILVVAERENWSYIRLEATKLRISAFPLAAPVGRERQGWFL
jgi:hypothetical protein